MLTLCDAKISMRIHRNVIRNERLAQEKKTMLYSYIYLFNIYIHVYEIYECIYDLVVKSIILNIISDFSFENYIICHLLDLYIWPDIILSFY